LLRRRALLLALGLVAALPPLALATGRDVLADFNDNGQIDSCYTLQEYQQALRLLRPDQAQYGSAVDVIRQAEITNVKVAGQPCGAAATAVPTSGEEESGGVSPLVWVGVIAGVGVVAIGAGTLARRRRTAGPGGSGPDAGPDGQP
jgi:hypothetical protein